MHGLAVLLKRLNPGLAPVSPAERLRASVGALIGILITGFVTKLALGPTAGLPLLIAPMGASAVLLFAVPASPLAQPWSILGGNVIAALIGVTAATWITDPFVAAAVAGGAAIGAMMLLGCLHPPGGAVALTAVLGGPAVQAAGYGFVLWPVGVNSVLLLAAALVFNNLTGRRYPHRQLPSPALDHKTSDPKPSARLGFTSADLDAAITARGELLDIDRDDLEDILHEAEERAFHRRSGEITCADIMSRDVAAVSPESPWRDALALLRAHRVKALPVTTEDARVVGIVTQSDLLHKVAWGPKGPRIGLAHRFRRAARLERAPQGTVEEIMTTPVRSARPETLIAALVPLMADGGWHHLPIVSAHGQLVGVVTQSDLIAALFHGHVTAKADGRPAARAA
ncbi:MAG: HPP family protein [Rhizobiales bacterium]|nr:HPP family protein [Hyphomicrobiales bacterium]